MVVAALSTFLLLLRTLILLLKIKDVIPEVMIVTNMNMISKSRSAFSTLLSNEKGNASAIGRSFRSLLSEEGYCSPRGNSCRSLSFCKCLHPVPLVFRGWRNNIALTGVRIEFPCGHCPACRSRSARDWASRLYCESLTSSGSLFITLTYNRYYLPDGRNLYFNDVSNFFRRVRLRGFEGVLKHYTYGEYGTARGRPHYHSVIFFPIELLDKLVARIRRQWYYGHVDIDPRPPRGRAFSYVTNYVLFKDRPYGNRVRPQSRQSLGLGLSYLLANSSSIRNLKYIPGTDGWRFPLSRYYIRKLYPESVRRENFLNTLIISVDERIQSGLSLGYRREFSLPVHKERKTHEFAQKNYPDTLFNFVRDSITNGGMLHWPKSNISGLRLPWSSYERRLRMYGWSGFSRVMDYQSTPECIGFIRSLQPSLLHSCRAGHWISETDLQCFKTRPSRRR